MLVRLVASETRKFRGSWGQHVPTLNIIARELALDLADACFVPDIVAHSPGGAMGTADALSRKFQPGVVFQLPLALARDNAILINLPQRNLRRRNSGQEGCRGDD